MRRALIAVAALAALAIVGISLRIHSTGEARGRAGGTGRAMPHYGPAPLVARGSLERRLRRLRGRPVVVNAWASWCAPCREELPLLGAAAARLRGRVAFLGADVEDDPGRARELLAELPVGYPSYPADRDQLEALAPFHGTPTTLFLSPSGELAGTHIGAYESAAELADDLRRYASD
jgi:thiol-disulfide isomerase/thioredoxin